MEKMVEVERATQEELRQDLKSLFQGAIRVTLEMVLEEELKAMVGARRFERVGSRKDHRNSTCPPRWLSMAHTVWAASRRVPVVCLNSSVSDSPATANAEICSSVIDESPSRAASPATFQPFVPIYNSELRATKACSKRSRS